MAGLRSARFLAPEPAPLRSPSSRQCAAENLTHLFQRGVRCRDGAPIPRSRPRPLPLPPPRRSAPRPHLGRKHPRHRQHVLRGATPGARGRLRVTLLTAKLVSL
jgi:hypothetical protein